MKEIENQIKDKMKKYNNTLFIIIFILLSIFVLTFNIIVDPFDIKKYSEKKNYLCLNSEPSELAYTIMYLDRNNKYEYVMVGGSTLASLFYVDSFYKFTRKTVFQAVLGDISPNEKYELLKDYLELHPETKKIIIEISTHPYIQRGDKQIYKKEYKNESFLKVYFSFNATKKSLQKIIKKNSLQDNSPRIITRPDLKYNYKTSHIKENIEALKKIKELVNEKELNAIFFAPPVHALHLANCYESGAYEYIEEAKKMFAEITPFYDMSFISKYTTIKMDGEESYYYSDIIHPSVFMMKEILPVILDRKVDNNTSILITKENIDEELIKQRKKLEEYIKNNRKDVDAYKNNKYDPKHYEQSKSIIVHFKDLPEDIKKKYLLDEKY